MGARKLIVLDRDGVINQDSPDYIKSADEFVPIRGSVEAIARLCQAGYRVVIASNQSGIGRGLFDHEALHAIHDKLIRLVTAAGGALSGIYVCPHHPDADCTCRKPKPGLLERLARDLETDLRGVPVIGDSRRDMEAAGAVGARPILVRTGNGAAAEAGLSQGPPMEVFDDLAEAANHLLGEPA